ATVLRRRDKTPPEGFPSPAEPPGGGHVPEGTGSGGRALGPERWQALSPYLDHALDLPPGEVASWVASLRADQPDLAADLEKLLEDRLALGRDGFLENASPSPFQPSPLQPSPPGQSPSPQSPSRHLSPPGQSRSQPSPFEASAFSG